MILVTSAAGRTGRAVLAALASRGAAARALVHRDAQAEAVRAAGARDVAAGDLLDAASLRRALDGVDAIYHVCPNMSPHEVEIGRAMMDAARTAGVRRFVFHSALHAQTEKMPNHWHKMRVEELLFETGLDYTILQPTAYMQNVVAVWQTIVEEGIYRVPYSAATRIGMVDLRDVAAVAARVLIEPGHVGATYELAGPDVLTQDEISAVLADVLGRPVRAERIPLDVWARGAGALGLGPYQIDAMSKLFRYCEQYGLWGNARVLGWLLDRPATGFRAFVEDFCAAPAPSAGR
ncbi:MAG: nucleoside-diphosphate sugar epimerase [Proteobacteria bacterium]|nr:MAG: nucleoside-diphosphate sugar epimerase [Pseudomonadota bacterium]